MRTLVENLVKTLGSAGVGHMDVVLFLPLVVIIDKLLLDLLIDLIGGGSGKLLGGIKALHGGLSSLHVSVVKIPERRVDVVSVADEGYHRDLEIFGQLAQRCRKHGSCAAERVSSLGIDGGDIPPVDDFAQLFHQRCIARELALADAADEAQKPLALEVSVDGHNIVDPVRKRGFGCHLEIHEGVVVAQQKIRWLDTFHIDLLKLILVLSQIRSAEEPDQGSEVHAADALAHIEMRVVVKHRFLRSRGLSDRVRSGCRKACGLHRGPWSCREST